MTLDRISLTLYDFLGYLLPGYVLLLGLSVAESSLAATSVLGLPRLAEHPLVTSIAAYYLGHVSHRLGSLLKDWQPKWFRDEDKSLSGPVYASVAEAAKEVAGVTLGEGQKLPGLDVYVLADTYWLASGGCSERDIWIAREGFYKASMVSFASLTVVVLVSAFLGGTTIEVAQGTAIQFACVESGVVGLALLGVTLAFWRGFVFYNCLKVNNTKTALLALRARDRLRTKE